MNDIIGQKRLYIFLGEYYEFLETMEDTQNRKISALALNSLEEIQKTISVQQAEIMTLNNMEEKRMRLQKELGMENYTFKEIIDAADVALAEEFRGLFLKIEACLEQIKFLNTKAAKYLKTRLGEREFEADGYSYSGAHTHTAGAPSILQTKI